MAEKKLKKKEPVPVKKPRVRRKKVEQPVAEAPVEVSTKTFAETPQFGVWLVVAAVAALIIAIVVS